MEYLLRRTELHNYLIDMADGHGLTTSLRAYARALQNVSTGRHTFPNFILKKRNIRKLRFLYHKRRMFPGFDLHILLMHMFPMNTDEINTVKDQRNNNYTRSISSKKDQSQLISLPLSLALFSEFKHSSLLKIHEQICSPLKELLSSLDAVSYTHLTLPTTSRV